MKNQGWDILSKITQELSPYFIGLEVTEFNFETNEITAIGYGTTLKEGAVILGKYELLNIKEGGRELIETPWGSKVFGGRNPNKYTLKILKNELER